MFQKHMVSESDFDDAKSNVRLNEAQLEACFAQIKIAEIKQKSTELERESVLAELDGAIARINQMEALFKVAQINLKNTRICSPIEGIVISRKVSVGQTVAASLQAPTLFTIANDLRRMQIEALIDESDICKIKTGQIATFSVDAFPNRKFQGSVSQVRLAPTTQNVVMYTVIINVNNEDLALKPGITAKIEILVEERQDVLRIPTQVLFFIPPPEILARFPTSIQENEETETSLVWVQSSASGIYPLEIHTGVSNAIYTEVMNEPFASGACLVARVKEWWTDWFGL
ncbi:efflux RND transporter periplasmic adaptor subunit [bacterium]|nr:efflux RND transporter periplasmic adaptor subunit [bacterium]